MMTATTTTAATQEELRRKLEQFKQLKDLERRKSKVDKKRQDSLGSKTFVVPLPRKNSAPTFVPSIIAASAPKPAPLTPRSVNAVLTVSSYNVNSISKNTMSSAKSACLGESAAPTVSKSSGDVRVVEDRDWNLRSNAQSLYNLACQKASSSPQELELVHKAFKSFFSVLDCGSALSPRPLTLFKSSATYRESNLSKSVTNFDDDGEEENDENNTGDDEDSDDEIEINGYRDDNDDDEDAFGNERTPPQSKYLDDNGDGDSDVDDAFGDEQTPPRSKYIDNDIDSKSSTPDSTTINTSSPAVTSKLAFKSTPLARFKPQRVKGTPHPRRKDEVLQIVNMLEGVSLSPGSPVDASGSSCGTDDGGAAAGGMEKEGSIMVLTPRRANKKEKAELGVTSVVTSARRSLRFFRGDTSVAVGSVEEAMPNNANSVTEVPIEKLDSEAKKKVVRMLEENGMTYVPNVLVQTPKSNIPLTAGVKSKSTSKPNDAQGSNLHKSRRSTFANVKSSAKKEASNDSSTLWKAERVRAE